MKSLRVHRLLPESRRYDVLRDFSETAPLFTITQDNEGCRVGISMHKGDDLVAKFAMKSEFDMDVRYLHVYVVAGMDALFVVAVAAALFERFLSFRCYFKRR